MESEVTVLIEEERAAPLLPPGQGEPILARLRKYLIADRVELAHERIAGRWLIGPAAGLAELAASAGLPGAGRISASPATWPAGSSCRRIGRRPAGAARPGSAR